MIQRHVKLILLVLLIGASWSGVAAPAPVPDPLQQVVLNWFTALRSGDTAAIATLLGPQELSRSGPLLKNPDYGQFLRERYRDATFEITGHTVEPDGASFVDVAITLGAQETMRERYVFEPAPVNQLRIGRRVALP